MIKLKDILNEVFDVNLLEKDNQVNKYEIFCDLDGVLVDFDKSIYQLTGMDFEKSVNSMGYDKLWNMINSGGEKWWATLPWTPQGHKLWSFIMNRKPTILTAGSIRNTLVTDEMGKRKWLAEIGKKDWCAKNLGASVPVIVTEHSKDKQNYSKPNAILIDDLEQNINEWNSKGGIGILHKDVPTTISQLTRILRQ